MAVPPPPSGVTQAVPLTDCSLTGLATISDELTMTEMKIELFGEVYNKDDHDRKNWHCYSTNLGVTRLPSLCRTIVQKSCSSSLVGLVRGPNTDARLENK